MAQPVPYNKDCPIYQFALGAYQDNSNLKSIDIEEFVDDYSRFWYIIKLIVMYINSGEINTRLLFNHLTILMNMFGLETREILLKIALDKGNYEVIQYCMTLLYYIGFIPDNKLMDIIGDEYLLDIPLSKEFLNYLENGVGK